MNLKEENPTCSYKDRATIRLLAPHSQACDRTHRWGWWCWLAVRRQEGGGEVETFSNVFQVVLASILGDGQKESEAGSVVATL